MAKRLLTALSTKQIIAEIERRKKKLGKLESKRVALVKQLVAIEEEISSLGGTTSSGDAPRKPGKRGRPPKAVKATKTRRKTGKRPKNTASLPEAMVAVMSKDTPMKAADIAAAVTASGYKSNSSNFKTIIFQTLGREKKLFAKKARGEYVLK
ncbi:MAG TPA: hypothetical protein PKE55_06735 [Kiritimatiellia bacterium]|nr:hypothetical protein [Kiritimatiellia bacterium]